MTLLVLVVAAPLRPRRTPVPGSRAREARSHCRRIGAPPRARQEGKRDLTDAPRSPDRSGANSRRGPPAEPRTSRSGRRESGRLFARAEGVGLTSNPPDFRKSPILFRWPEPGSHQIPYRFSDAARFAAEDTALSVGMMQLGAGQFSVSMNRHEERGSRQHSR